MSKNKPPVLLLQNAAPDLLMACKAVLSGGYGCAPSVEYMDSLKKKCEKAINKAEGINNNDNE